MRGSEGQSARAGRARGGIRKVRKKNKVQKRERESQQGRCQRCIRGAAQRGRGGLGAEGGVVRSGPFWFCLFPFVCSRAPDRLKRTELERLWTSAVVPRLWAAADLVVLSRFSCLNGSLALPGRPRPLWSSSTSESSSSSWSSSRKKNDRLPFPFRVQRPR